MTRRPALAEALSRHARTFGLTLIEGALIAAVPAAAEASDELVIVDADTYAEHLRSVLTAPDSHRQNLVVVAAPAEADTAALAPLVEAGRLVCKPVQRAELYRALAASLQAPAASSVPGESTVAAPTQIMIGAHVLVVDDEPVNAAVAQGYLAALGCTSVWVDDGAAAVARCATERFDLILLDISMPVMDGFATAALIRTRQTPGCRVPIVALTAHDSTSYRERCLAAGMDDLLGKPYTFEACAIVLRRWIAQPGGSQRAPRPHPSLVRALTSVEPTVVAGIRKLPASGHANLYSRLVSLFQTSSCKGLAELRAALAACDLKAAGASCHKLRASAANVGALGFAVSLRELEQLCSSGDIAGAQRQFDLLSAAWPALLEELQRLTLVEVA